MPLQCDTSRVLLVDDEAAIRRIFRMILASGLSGCQIEVAGNGLEAVEAFGRDHHAVLLMDLHMPVMDGQRAFGEIERLCATRDWEMPSVVFCTGFAPPDSVIGLVQARHEHGLLLKPVNSATLINAIKSRLDHRRSG